MQTLPCGNGMVVATNILINICRENHSMFPFIRCNRSEASSCHPQTAGPPQTDHTFATRAVDGHGSLHHHFPPICFQLPKESDTSKQDTEKPTELEKQKPFLLMPPFLKTGTLVLSNTWRGIRPSPKSWEKAMVLMNTGTNNRIINHFI